MRRFRVPLSALMLAVAIVAVDIAVLRTLERSENAVHVQVDGSTELYNCMEYALGVLPTASVLLFVAAIRLPALIRRGGEASFFVGFQMFGWAAVFGFIGAAALNPMWVPDLLRATTWPIAPITEAAERCLPSPAWAEGWGDLLLIGPAAAVLGLPQLLFALFGGWLVRRAGIVVRVERRSPRAPRPSVLPLTVPPG